MLKRSRTLMKGHLLGLAVLLVGTAPVVADEIYPSVDNAPTAEGSAETDPWVGTDRVPPNNPPSATESNTFDKLDYDGNNRLEQDELNAYGSSAAGSNIPDSDKRGERNLEFYDQNDDSAVSRDEFSNGQSAEKGQSKQQNRQSQQQN